MGAAPNRKITSGFGQSFVIGGRRYESYPPHMCVDLICLPYLSPDRGSANMGKLREFERAEIDFGEMEPGFEGPTMINPLSELEMRLDIRSRLEMERVLIPGVFRV